MVEVSHVFVSFGEKQVLRDCSLSLPAGSRTALTGPSGCGKTTLLRLIAGLARPDRGAVSVEAKRLAVVFQEPRLLPGRTAAENVNAVLSDGPATMERARALLRRAGLGDALDALPETLSGGMQQRVSLCRALACGGDLLLLDEPFRGLDRPRAEEMAALILENAKTLLLVTHDPREAALLTDRTLSCRDGRFLE